MTQQYAPGGKSHDDSEEDTAGQVHVQQSNLDDLLDDIDTVLETDAQSFVQSFVQKGGE